MAGLSLSRLAPGEAQAWDAFVAGAVNGSLFHRQDFLGYHSARFKETAHHLVWRKGSTLFAVLPLGIFLEEGRKVARSPFGASIGGFVHGPKLRLKYALELVDQLMEHLRDQGVHECLITTPPACYARSYTNAAEFALCSRGFTLRNREITHAINLGGVSDPFLPLDSSTRTQARKARRLGVTLQRNAPLETAYALVVRAKQQLGREGITHSEADLRAIRTIDPNFLKVDLAWLEGVPVAANVFLCSPTCITSFYPSCPREYAHTSALTLLTLDAIQWCLETGRTHLDLGCSSSQMVVNASLSEFKESFGASGYFRDTFGVAL
ncbi:GNAT family N-acetyltransferase [Geothrix sp. PMB-07]|uniref:GNAT family N-acetyltransferase n=1 Tax=Geothrix sp. PMB-07 TaxID=3068640 RepID=UPI0027408E34|nr:GNAT family N-acetyltransferase [Geothrix sp. PMB-07]WLT31793.1 GNAT family N-acetyltransferase [Geothrix sp. PMB-07]